jgi:hypothetical protein
MTKINLDHTLRNCQHFIAIYSCTVLYVVMKFLERLACYIVYMNKRESEQASARHSRSSYLLLVLATVLLL